MNSEKSPQPRVASRDYFIEAHDQAQLLQDQNDRYAFITSDEVLTGSDDQFRTASEEFRDAMKHGLQVEQADTLDTLRAQDTSPYEVIANAQRHVEQQIGEAQQRLETIQDEEDDRKTRLLAMAKRAIELSPYAKDEVDEIYQRHLKDLNSLNRTGLKERLGELRADAAVIAALFDIASRPWPVPMINEGLPLAEDDDESDFIDLPDLDEFIVDSMPGEPRLSDRESVTKRLVERYGHTPNASIMATAFLIENQGKVLTPLDVGTDVYSESDELEGMPEEKSDRLKYCRILTLLNPNQGSVPEMLYKEGFELQYGDRIIYNGLGKQKGPARRLYRAVPITPDYIPGSSFTEELRFGNERDIVEKTETTSYLSGEDQEIEMNADESDIQVIEASVSLSKSEKNRLAMEAIISEAQQAAPVLFNAGLLPAERDGKISYRRIVDLSMRKGVARALRQSPVLLRIDDHSKSFKYLDNKATAAEVLISFTPAIENSNVPLNRQNHKIAKERLEAMIDELYDEKADES